MMMIMMMITMMIITAIVTVVMTIRPIRREEDVGTNRLKIILWQNCSCILANATR